MKFSRHFLTVALIAIILGECWLGWRQWRELALLRPQMLTTKERADIASEMAAARAKERDLQAKLAGAKQKIARKESQAGSDGSQPRPVKNVWRTALENPESLATLKVAIKANLDRTYGRLFASLNLTPEQLEKFKNLLVERQVAKTETTMVAEENGVTVFGATGDFHEALKDGQQGVNDQINALLGPAGYDQFRQYQVSYSLRQMVDEFQQTLTNISAPLTADQTNQLVQTWLQTMSPTQLNGLWTGTGVQYGSGLLSHDYDLVAVPPEGFDAAKGILTSPAQLEALQKFEAAVQAQFKLRQMANPNAQ